MEITVNGMTLTGNACDLRELIGMPTTEHPTERTAPSPVPEPAPAPEPEQPEQQQIDHDDPAPEPETEPTPPWVEELLDGATRVQRAAYRAMGVYSVSIATMAERMDVDRTTAVSRMRRLEQLGLATRVRRGVYRAER